ncbi:MAG: diaminopimelate epimerase, partial [Desulfovibrio piger]|nr:diaminopimelate epimerase [Desulfovibrio piger]
MRKIAFTKMEGCGNDYVYLDGVSEDLRLAEGDIPVLARAVSDRHYGVGSDGLVLILPPTSPDSADLRMRMFNADGSEAEMCGNASRCVGRFAWEHALTDRPVIRLETLAGIKLLQRVDDAGG